jgi:hypothetical protein
VSIPSNLRFELVNGIRKVDVESNKFKIYLHKCPDGIYVGVSDDPVRRWQEHCLSSSQEESPNYKEPLKKAIRKYGQNFSHYIVAVAAFEKSSRNKEAEAINYYSANLNVRPEVSDGKNKPEYKPLESQIPIVMVLSKSGREGANYSRGDDQRKPVRAQVIFDSGRKRVVSVENNNFPKGLFIQCSRSEKNKLSVGDVVTVNVAVSKRADGSKYLVAAKTATLVKV